MSEGSQASFVVEDEMLDANVTETYMGEWKNDKRCGFGISERSDGLKYEGEWFNNRKYGYGVTTFKDGSREEGKYKNNILITSNKKKHLFLIRSAKFRERIDSAVNAAQRASKIALQKADIAISRTATARGKAEQADYAAVCAREDSTEARGCANTFDPNFHQPGMQHEAETKLDLRVPGKLSLGGAAAASHQTGPGPPSQSLNADVSLTNHVGPGQSVIKPLAPPPAKPSIEIRPTPSSVPQPPAPAPPAPVKPVPAPTQPPPMRAPPKQLSPQPVSDPRNNNLSDIAGPSVSNKPGPPPLSPLAPPPLLTAPPPRNDVTTPTQPDPTVMRQPTSLAVSDAGASLRGRTPTRQERSRAAAPSP